MKFQSDYTYASIAHIDKIVTENNQTIQGAPDIRKAPDQLLDPTRLEFARITDGYYLCCDGETTASNSSFPYQKMTKRSSSRFWEFKKIKSSDGQKC